jgi:hypothetical protein
MAEKFPGIEWLMAIFFCRGAGMVGINKAIFING